MAISQAPTNKKGVAIPPTPDDRKCIGDECWYEKCEPTDHHNHFDHIWYVDHPDDQTRELATEFCNDPFNRTKMYECAHDIWHWLYEGIPVPELELMRTYVSEANFLRVLEERLIGFTAMQHVLDGVAEGYVDWNELYRQRGRDYTEKMHRLHRLSDMFKAFEDNHLARREDIQSDLRLVSHIEVVPAEIVQLSVEKMKRQPSGLYVPDINRDMLSVAA
jgi:hypothetical protein